MKLSEYLLDRIFSLIYMLVAALVLLALLSVSYTHLTLPTIA